MRQTLPRKDIDGLRAVAVLIVMLFHAGMHDFAGGFVGVDVFFVISGYLIIPQLANRIAAGRVDLMDFFARRIRRLVPALVPVLVFAFGAAALLLGRGEFNDFIETLFGAAAYVSNYVLLSQSGYFARASDSTILLHTWSLGVEFQFYILAPFILIAVSRHKAVAVTVVAAASFLFASHLVSQGDDRAFYGILPRFWELAVGGILGLVQSRIPVAPKTGIVLRAFGLVLIAVCSTRYTSSMAFPGPAALVPVAGTVMILAAAPAKRDPVLWLLNSRLMQWIGTRSYSLYLWHWPLIVTATLAFDRPNDVHYISALLLSFLLAELSFRFVETPVRKAPGWRAPRAMAMLTLLPVTAGAAVWGLAFPPARYDALREMLPLANYRVVRDVADGERDEYMATIHSSSAPEGVVSRGIQCSYDDTTDIRRLRRCLSDAGFASPVLVIGDSQGRDVFHALRRAFHDHDFVLLHQSGCAPAEQPKGTGRECFLNLSALLPQVISDLSPSLIVLASSWPTGSPATIGETIDLVDGSGAPILVVGAGPVFRSPVPSQLRAIDLTNEAQWDVMRISALDLRYDIVGINAQLSSMARLRGIPFFDRYSTICDEVSCRAFVPQGRRLMIWDTQHLTIPGILWLGDEMRRSSELKRMF